MILDDIEDNDIEYLALTIADNHTWEAIDVAPF